MLVWCTGMGGGVVGPTLNGQGAVRARACDTGFSPCTQRSDRVTRRVLI